LVTTQQYPVNEAGAKTDVVALGNGDFAISDNDTNAMPSLLIVNPGDPNAPFHFPDTWTGFTDPATGQPSKGIWDRIREIIGRGGQTEITQPPIGDAGPYASWKAGDLNLNTEMGLDDWLLAACFEEQWLGGQGQVALNAYIDAENTSLDWWKKHKHALTVRRTRTTAKRNQIVIDRRNDDHAITNRFMKERNAVNSAARTQSFDLSQQRSRLLSGLTHEENVALGGVPAAIPTDFKGNSAAWYQQRQFERTQIRNVFAARRDAINQRAAKGKFDGQQSRSRALLALSLEEGDEKNALANAMDKKRINFDALITSLTNQLTGTGGATDTISTINTAITDAHSSHDNLDQYVKPNQDTATNINTLQLVDIPALKQEAHNFGISLSPAPTPGAQTTADLQNLLQLQNQRLQIQAQAIAASTMGLTVLTQAIASLPPFGGSFQAGGIVPGALGEPRTIIAHGGEKVTPASNGQATRVMVRMEDHRTRVWVDDVEQHVQQATSVAARHARRNLPGRAGGILT